MELPLDSAVARGLRRRARAEEARLPPWPGLRRLEREQNAKYQDFAAREARKENLPGRVFLDHRLWLENR
jgi:hypothetical protein